MSAASVRDRLQEHRVSRPGRWSKPRSPGHPYIYEELFELAPDAYLFTAPSGRILQANRAACALLNVRHAMLVGASLSAFIPTTVYNQMVRDLPAAGVDAQPLPEREIRLRRLRRLPTTVGATLGVARDESGRRYGYWWLLRDIAERERTAERLRAAVREKDLLLREVYHRVKNNLQVICSLLSLQEPTVADAGARQILEGARQRLRSMALLHQRLYASADVSRVDFAQHLRALARELRDSYGVSASQVRFALDLADMSLGIDVAIPCSMIVHELVTNALRHAFPEGRGQITLRLSAESPETARLVVADDGVGFAPERAARGGTLGLELVGMMADQMGARLEVRHGRGVQFEIVFPLTAADERRASR
jgi:PAS domain S-box-containing protein